MKFWSNKGLVSLICLLFLALLVTPTRIFLDPGNLTDILRQVSVTGIIALAMTFVILTAGIDLSVGSTLALATSVVAMGLKPNSSMAIAILTALAASAAVGAVNGTCVALLKIQPFVVTLATMIGIRGLAKWLTGNANIDIGFGQDVDAGRGCGDRRHATQPLVGEGRGAGPGSGRRGAGVADLDAV